MSVEPGTGSLLSASYVSGHVHVFPTAADGSVGPGSAHPLPGDGTYPGPIEVRQDAPHAHCYHPLGDKGYALCADRKSTSNPSPVACDSQVFSDSDCV